MEKVHRSSRRRASLALAGVLLCLAAGAAASPALAANTQLKEEFAPFLDCPTATANTCVASETTGGEFQMGYKQVPIDKPIELQGGLTFTSLQLIPARDGDTLIGPPLTVPGGLIGIEGLGGEVTATAMIAGPATGIQVDQFYLVEGGGVAVVLPLKIKLDNPLLGEECWIGSDSEPVVLHLTVAKKGTLESVGKKKITKVSGATLVDESFAVPAATGCGDPSWLITPLVNLISGLPSPAGHNKAVMIGSFEQTAVKWALRYAKPPKERK